MAFSYASGRITQANTASTAVTAVASGGTGLLDLTVASSASYTANDLVVLTTFTSYNGTYFVDSIPNGTTIRISDTDILGNTNSFGATESGNIALGDKDLSGISGLTGVTVTTSNGLTIYTTTNKLRVNGNMIIDERFEQFISSARNNTTAVTAAVVEINGEIITFSSILGAFAIFFAAINIFGGFFVTQRMLEMFKKKERKEEAKNEK